MAVCLDMSLSLASLQDLVSTAMMVSVGVHSNTRLKWHTVFERGAACTSKLLLNVTLILMTTDVLLCKTCSLWLVSFLLITQGCYADEEWQLLQPMLLKSVLAWLDPHGSHGWAPPSSIMENVEPICSALNLCRFLLLCEQAQISNLTEVLHQACGLVCFCTPLLLHCTKVC